MMGLSLSRILAVLAKEFTQLVRDRLTYAMIIGIPVLQLLLFGYAINTDPKHLPTAVLVQDQGDFSRSVITSLRNSQYFDIVDSVALAGRIEPADRTRFGAVRDHHSGRFHSKGRPRREPAIARRGRRIGPGSDRSCGFRIEHAPAICASA